MSDARVVTPDHDARAVAPNHDARAVAPDHPAGLDLEARRLLWRCRRGMKELDLILERFARGYLATAHAAQRECFARFLELPDPLLADYLLGNAVPQDLPLARLVRAITEPVAPTCSC